MTTGDRATRESPDMHGASDPVDARFDGDAGRPAFTPASLASLLPALRLLVGLLIATILITALYVGRSLLIPLALAALFGFLLDPLVSRLHRWGLPRVIAVFFVVAFALGAVGGVGVYVTTQLTALSADLPTYRSTIRDKLHALRVAASKPSAWDGALKTLQTVQKEIDTAPAGANAAAPAKVEVVAPESRPVQLVLDWLSRVSEPVATAGICLLFVILILLDRRNLRDRLLRLAGGDLHVATDAMDEASERIGRYLRMQFLINTCYAVPMGWACGGSACPQRRCGVSLRRSCALFRISGRSFRRCSRSRSPSRCRRTGAWCCGHSRSSSRSKFSAATSSSRGCTVPRPV